MAEKEIREKIKRVNGTIKPSKRVNWDTNTFFKVKPISLGRSIVLPFRVNCTK